MNRSTRFALAAGSLILIGCKTETVAPPPSGPSFAVSDGAHSGNPDFFFLPPMFKNPNTNPNYEPAAFNPNLRPAVEICLLGVPALDGSRECVGGPITRFEPSQISVSLTDQQYQVNWRTDLSNLNLAMFYRIQVLVGTRVLGFADVDPVANLGGKGLQNLQTGEFIPLVDGRTLPIKFRLETGVLCATDGTPCNSSTVNLNTGGTIELLGAGEDFKLDIRTGTTATFNGQPVTDVTFNLEVCRGIDVDLPTFGPCLRVSTYFNATGTGTLEFSKPLLLSMCVLNTVYHTLGETRQEGLITLHQQDGTLIQALPHAEPNCGSGTIGTSGWGWLRDLAERFLAPTPAHAATRSALLHVGAGGEPSAMGSTCPPASPTYARVPGVTMTTSCPPSSPTVEGSGPQRAATALISPPRTVSDFQFALPAKMDYLNRADADRTAAPGTALPTAVKVTDWDGAPVLGAHVTFVEPAIEGPPTVVGTAVSDVNGVAQILWIIRAGSNTAVATGRGIAAQNNYPNATVKPFMPDISLPTNQQSPVALGTGRVTFRAQGGLPDLVIDNIVVGPVDLTFADYVTYDVTIRNQGTAAAPASIVFLDGPSAVDGHDVGADVLNAPALAVGATATLRSRLGPRAPGGATVTANADQNNLIAESNESNNSFTTQFSVAAKITFETLGNGTPISDIALPLALVNDYSLQGLAFSFVTFDEHAGVASLCNSSGADPVGVTTNHAATIQASGDPCSGFTQGQITLTFDPAAGLPTTVRFQLRGNNAVDPFAVFGLDAAGSSLGELVSDVSTYTTNNGFLARQETVQVGSSAGITQIHLNLPAGTGAVFIDNLVIIR